jgi:hypothetical protein
MSCLVCSTEAQWGGRCSFPPHPLVQVPHPAGGPLMHQPTHCHHPPGGGPRDHPLVPPAPNGGCGGVHRSFGHVEIGLRSGLQQPLIPYTGISLIAHLNARSQVKSLLWRRCAPRSVTVQCQAVQVQPSLQVDTDHQSLPTCWGRTVANSRSTVRTTTLKLLCINYLLVISCKCCTAKVIKDTTVIANPSWGVRRLQ